MPLEINEIGISMRVSDDVGSRPDFDRSAQAQEGEAPLKRDDLIEECVRRVLEALRLAGER